MENVRNRTKRESFRKNRTDKVIKQQSGLFFSGFQKSFENYDGYTFKQNEVLMDRPIYLGFSELELSELLLYETYYDLVLNKKNFNCIIWILFASY